ncbi:hypothetical protein Pmar_PMAR023773 [Perkinsus marinus ATCC 50983]|uniref:UDENN domain-containing protein n=1 Tax=Perkinsus marinus (strain ATCC 50983 / TXsc) TaxID=423536 RepID=C5KCI1_PERM5|nr:hypothetical protein Pmar_PMAR023773 [Perkinsus marinus ATCC 50983]EER17843.1 hypothetical protein Pmar_PMAR023773 [Perkinsus marinus ATCC 50983]|eukprot:XP_002786047.1 hypothetical protein Pmar_PMAR023773 [Perkinsus marinus ATCC 50983]
MDTSVTAEDGKGVGEDSSSHGSQSIGEASRNNWLVCTAAFAFDLEVGQAMECMYPAEALSSRDAKTLSFLAFPDSNLTRAGTDDISCLYSVRFRCQDRVVSDDFYDANATSDRSRYLFATCLFRQHRDEDNPRGFYQKTIAVVSRHPFTELWSTVVSGPMVEAYTAAERCGTCPQVLQQVWLDTCRWPKPKPAKTVTLPILSTRLSFVIPIGGPVSWFPRKVVGSSPSSSPRGSSVIVSSPQAPVVGSRERLRESVCGDGDISLEKTLAYLRTDSGQNEGPMRKRGLISAVKGLSGSKPVGSRAFSLSSSLQHHQVPWFLYSEVSKSGSLWPLMSSLWHLWEMAITGVPMLVYTPRQLPSSVSNAVFAILSLIQPVQYRGDYRPYFTIYDPDYEYYKTAPIGALPPCILGITSPMAFAQLSQNFPVVVVIDSDDKGDQKTDAPQLSDKVVIQQQGGSYVAVSPLLCSSSSNTRTLGSKLMEVTGAASVMGVLDVPSGGGGEGGGGRQTDEYRKDVGRWKLDLPPNVSVLKQLQDVDAKDGQDRRAAAFAINDAILNRHFQSLTCSFLAPFLQPYLSVEMAKRSIKSSPLSPTPLLPPFDLSALLASLTLAPDCPEPLAGLRPVKLEELYRKFVVESPNFAPWIRSQRENAFERIIRYHAKILCDEGRVAQHASSLRSIGDFDSAITVLRQVREDPSVQRLSRASSKQTAGGSSGSSDETRGGKSPRQQDQLQKRLSAINRMLSAMRKDFIQSRVQMY